MRVCVFGLRGFPLIQGGVEKHCEFLYPRMNKSITVIRRKPYVTKECLDAPHYDHIQFIDLPSTKKRGLEVVIHSFLATIKVIRLKPDVVHIHNIGSAIFIRMISRRKIPVVLTFHSPNYEHSKWNFLARKVLLYSEKVALKEAKKIIFVNRFQMEKYPKEVKAKSLYIPNGVNKPVISTSTSYLKEIGVEMGKYVLAIGRITPEKGFDTLIKAFNASKHDGYKLVIVGGVQYESKYYEELNRLANEDVVFTGYVYGDKICQLYSNASLFILSSNNEGFPLVLLEAMSYNLDVIVSDIPASHLVKLDKDDYFQHGDYKTLSEKITQRLQSLRHREYELEEYNWQSIAAKTEKVYELACQE